MAKLLKLRRGTTSQHSSFTGAEGEVTIDTTKDTAVVHDGSQAGGRPLLREDLSNLGTGAIVTAKIADGAVTAAKMGTFGSNTVGTTQLVDQNVTLDKLPHGTSSNDGKFLRANNGADPSFEVVNTDLVADTSPQLGGTLDSNGNVISLGDASGVNVNRIKLGVGNDMHIYHNGTNSNVREEGDGDLLLHTNNGSAIKLTSGSDENMVVAKKDDAVELYFNGSKKLETVTGGVTVTGTCTATAFAGDGSALTGIAGIPSGVIAMWSGAINAIPSGWLLCDGNNSTPDLRDKFIVGAGDFGHTAYPGVDPGATGGSQTGTITISVNGNTGWASQYSNASSNPNASPEPFNSRDRHQHGWGGNFPHTYDKMPPYYACAFIMKS